MGRCYKQRVGLCWQNQSLASAKILVSHTVSRIWFVPASIRCPTSPMPQINQQTSALRCYWADFWGLVFGHLVHYSVTSSVALGFLAKYAHFAHLALLLRLGRLYALLPTLGLIAIWSKRHVPLIPIHCSSTVSKTRKQNLPPNIKKHIKRILAEMGSLEVFQKDAVISSWSLRNFFLLFITIYLPSRPHLTCRHSFLLNSVVGLVLT